MSNFRRRLMMSIKKTECYEGYFDDCKVGYMSDVYINNNGIVGRSGNFAIYFVKIPPSATKVNLTNTVLFGATNTFLGICSDFDEETNEISDISIIRNSLFVEQTINLENIDKYLAVSIRKINSKNAYFKFN